MLKPSTDVFKINRDLIDEEHKELDTSNYPTLIEKEINILNSKQTKMSLKSDSKDSKMSNYSNNILSIQTNTKDVKAYKLRHSTPHDIPTISNSPSKL